MSPVTQPDAAQPTPTVPAKRGLSQGWIGVIVIAVLSVATAGWFALGGTSSATRSLMVVSDGWTSMLMTQFLMAGRHHVKAYPTMSRSDY